MKKYFAIIDTETTVDDTVADFACVIVDRHGEIFNQCAVLVKDHFDSKSLFYIPNSRDSWSREYAEQKRQGYNEMLDSGHRIMASVSAINRWLIQAIGKYNPMLTAYNLAFDSDKCANTGIDLSGFNSRFCLWQAAVGNICNTKKYRQFCVDNHAFNRVTEHGNMTFKTNAECVAGFIAGSFKTEPHTALEDARDFELPILQKIVNRRKWQDNVVRYDWRKFQVKDNFTAK
jgi:hypothetical protein